MCELGWIWDTEWATRILTLAAQIGDDALSHGLCRALRGESVEDIVPARLARPPALSSRVVPAPYPTPEEYAATMAFLRAGADDAWDEFGRLSGL